MTTEELEQMLDVGRSLVLSKHWEWVMGMPMLYSRLPIAWCSDKPPFEPGESAGCLDHVRVGTKVIRRTDGSIVWRPGDITVKTTFNCATLSPWRGYDDICLVPDLTNKYVRAMVVCMAQRHCRQALLVQGFDWDRPSFILRLLGDVRCVGSCNYTGGESGGTCPKCGGMLMSGKASADAAKLSATWEDQDEARAREVPEGEEGGGDQTS